ncbi:hypothetical protein BCR32DRAFT_293687 [Anaeromyces robustus]|uniref:Transglutaminase-like domain-containing protein n=1 Tax=Anaeromyces robustus TaxID=1754192 RepID=A0A1Y1X4U9_9FUNG|nr:hypothetical protein BCR32DRAFT_293687 [Anaeromyces robustus]|eukprot:ORX80678.1 hypothetical protein BCR32DRAFT_293687 [Anaeromyces robustus]
MNYKKFLLLLSSFIIYIVNGIPTNQNQNKNQKFSLNKKSIENEDNLILKEEVYYKGFLEGDKVFSNTIINDNNENTFNIKISSVDNSGDINDDNNDDDNNNDNDDNNNSSNTIQNIKYSGNGFMESLSSVELYIYKRLLTSSKKTYPDFSIVLYPIEDGYNVNNKNFKSSMVTAFISFLYDHTEFWWVYSYHYNCEYNAKTGDVQKVEIDLCWSNDFCKNYKVNDIKVMNEALESKKIEIINSIGNVDHKTSYQILRNIHDKLIHSVDLITDPKEEDIFSTTIYGVLVNGKGTSEGIAKTFRWFTEYYNIINVLAVGYGYQWNLVKLNEKWYAIDVTGDYKRSTINKENINEGGNENENENENKNKNKDGDGGNEDKDEEIINNTITDNISYDLFLIGSNSITNGEITTYEFDSLYKTIDRVKSTYSLTSITYPTLNTEDYFKANNVLKTDIFESTILSISSNSAYSNEVKTDPTNDHITTLISTFTTTVITVIQGNLDLNVVSEQIKEQRQQQCNSNIDVNSINNNINVKNTMKTSDNNNESSFALKTIQPKQFLYLFSFIITLFFL